jgi:DNA-directed RNA polymerase II subunit RPB3
VLQQKLASVIQDLSDGDGAALNGGGDGFGGPRSPDVNMDGGAGWGAEGYTTPYGDAGQASAWGGQGAATPYGATPYGQNAGSNGWN